MLNILRLFQWNSCRNRSPDALLCGLDPAVLDEIKRKTEADENKIPLDTPLSEARYVVFDLETTGLCPTKGDEITSVSAVVIENRQVKKEPVFDSLVNPFRPIPAIATEITGITDEMVKNAPSILEVMNKFLDFCRRSVLVVHNACFDLCFINLKLKKYCRTKIAHRILDTHILAETFLPNKCHAHLDDIIDYFGLTVHGRHTSLGDAKVTAEVFLKFLDILEKRGFRTLNDVYAYISSRTY